MGQLSSDFPLKRAHRQRLRQMYRSAGWPCLDAIEIDLLAAGLLERVVCPGQAEYLRLTDAGIQVLASSIEENRAAFDAHETLVRRVADLQGEQGRIAYLGLTLLSKPHEAWQHVRPDVFSIRRTTSEKYLEPMIHEIKVRRADLLADLKKPEKHEAYLAAAGSCTYVLAAGIGAPEEIPDSCGVRIAEGDRIIRVRSAPRLSPGLSFGTWMSLAMAVPYRSQSESLQLTGELMPKSQSAAGPLQKENYDRVGRRGHWDNSTGMWAKGDAEDMAAGTIGPG